MPIDSQNLDPKPWPVQSIPDGAFAHRGAASKRQGTLHTILAGEAVVDSRLSSNKTGSGMAPLIPENMRGFAVRATAGSQMLRCYTLVRWWMSSHQLWLKCIATMAEAHGTWMLLSYLGKVKVLRSMVRWMALRLLADPMVSKSEGVTVRGSYTPGLPVQAGNRVS